MLMICLFLYVFRIFLSLFKGSLSQGSLICLLYYAYFFSTYEPEDAYKSYAYKKKHVPNQTKPKYLNRKLNLIKFGNLVSSLLSTDFVSIGIFDQKGL